MNILGRVFAGYGRHSVNSILHFPFRYIQSSLTKALLRRVDYVSAGNLALVCGDCQLQTLSPRVRWGDSRIRS